MAVDCERQDICTKEYSFDFPISIESSLDTFQTGDTIWITMEYDNNNLLDLNTGEYFAAGDFEFFIEMLITTFTPQSHEDGIDFFNYGTTAGELNRQYLVGISELTLDFQMSNSDRILIAYFIPQQPGNYSMVFTTILNHDEVSFLDLQCKETMNITFNLNNGADNNFEFYQTNSNDTIVTLESFKAVGGYAFTVID